MAGGTIVAGAIVVLGLAWWLGYFEEPPAEASLEDAVASVQSDDDTETTTVGESADTESDSTFAGVWIVDGTSDITFAGYRINEVLTTIGDFEVVGRTSEVEGEVVIDGLTITSAEFEVDMQSVTTDNDRRDASMREQSLETDQFPTSQFVLTEPIEIGDPPASGSSISVTAVGDLTIHGVTQSVSFPLEAQPVGDTIVVVGQLDILLTDYGIDPPQAPIVAGVDDQAVLELSVALTQSS
ncbi:MAG: YceI family protein [Acidimicrobiales bacterium]